MISNITPGKTFFLSKRGPFYAGPNNAKRPKLTPIRAGVIRANKVVHIRYIHQIIVTGYKEITPASVTNYFKKQKKTAKVNLCYEKCLAVTDMIRNALKIYQIGFPWIAQK